jgi:Beta-1,4-xylanase
LKRFAALGLELHITELDVGCNYMSKYASSGCLSDYDNEDDSMALANGQKQVEIYEVVLKSCLEIPKCTVFEMWGFTDYTFGSLLYLFDCDGRPKDAYARLLSLLKREEASGCVEVVVVKYNFPTSTTTEELLETCPSFADGCSDGWACSGCTLTVSSGSQNGDAHSGFVTDRTGAGKGPSYEKVPSSLTSGMTFTPSIYVKITGTKRAA